MKTFEQVDFFDRNPETSAYYNTDMGFLKYDHFTRSFYKNNSPIKVTYFFREIKAEKPDFDNVVRPVIKYLCENHHPHVSIIITPTNAELFEGIKSTGKILEYLKD